MKRKSINNNKDIFKIVSFIILLMISILSIIVDIIIKSTCPIFNKLNEILFSTVTVIAGFWVTSYLLFFQLYKDRYPLKFVKDKYLPQMKYNFTYIIYSIIFGCFVVIKNGGIFENIWFATVALFTILIVLKYTYDTSKSIMVNTYIDDFCDEISLKLNNKENCVKNDIFKDLRYILDESIVKEEYFIVQNIAKKTGQLFEDFISNSILIVQSGETNNEITKSFERLIDISIYQLEICKNVASDLLISDVGNLQVLNLRFCIKTNQYEWFKNYFKELSLFAFKFQKNNNKNIIDEIFVIYNNILKTLIKEMKIEWIEYVLGKIFTMTTSLNYIDENINLKYFANTIVNSLLYCIEEKKEDEFLYIYSMFEKFTNIACRIPKGFSDIKVYYALYFNEIIKENIDQVPKFLNTIFENGQDNGDDSAWTEFKFYCISETKERQKGVIDKDLRNYHLGLINDVIEMKERYKGYVILPNFEKEILDNQYFNEKIPEICSDIHFLLNKTIINDNIEYYYILIRKTSQCILNLESKHKEIQCNIFDIFIWLINRTKKILNKQYLEIAFTELEDCINELDKKRVISNNFGLYIIQELTNVARHSESDNNAVIINIIDMYSNFLHEGKELQFINTSVERKKELFRGLFNIGTSCIENDFEEGLRRTSNAIGWFIIYNMKQGSAILTNYLINLASELYNISKQMQVTPKTQTFILTLFTTIGTYCCKEPIYQGYMNLVLNSIKDINKDQVYTAIKLRTSENDMWDELFDKKTKDLTNKFIKKYNDFIKN